MFRVEWWRTIWTRTWKMKSKLGFVTRLKDGTGCYGEVSWDEIGVSTVHISYRPGTTDHGKRDRKKVNDDVVIYVIRREKRYE